MPVENEIPTHLNIRIDPKVRYITELAARASQKTVTEYVEAALKESFKKVSIDPLQDLDSEPNYQELTVAERIEKLKNRVERPVSNPLSEVMDGLWSDYRFVRMQLLAGAFNHLMDTEEIALWNYVHNRKDLRIAGKGDTYNLDREKIVREWDAIKADFSKAKGKTK